jgi:hypothetical protein
MPFRLFPSIWPIQNNQQPTNNPQAKIINIKCMSAQAIRKEMLSFLLMRKVETLKFWNGAKIPTIKPNYKKTLILSKLIAKI